MSRSFKVALVVLLLLLAATLIWLPFSPGFWLRENMVAAEAHAPKIRQLLNADARFKHLDVGANPDLDGSVYVLGALPADRLADLKNLVLSTSPPRPIL